MLALIYIKITMQFLQESSFFLDKGCLCSYRKQLCRQRNRTW